MSFWSNVLKKKSILKLKCGWSENNHISEEYQSYCAGYAEVIDFIPRCNKDPRSGEGQIWKICVYIPSGVCENISTGVLTIWNNTFHMVVKVSPETSNYILASVRGKRVGSIFWWSLVECEVSIIIHLKHEKYCQSHCSQMSL